MSLERLDRLVSAHKAGAPAGLVSICSSHPTVLRAAMRRAAREGGGLLIESTCNQVNQFGGYTGMTPADFTAYIRGLAGEAGLDASGLLLGGDHLGPSVWQEEPAAEAMAKAESLVRAYVLQGYLKIHLDASMHLGDDDPVKPLDVELAARRSAELARSAEQAHAERPELPAPRYVIGTEVPIPGGARQHEQGVQVTRPEDARTTLEATRREFQRLGLETAWERVVALVVQPGVEFGDDFVLDYRREAARPLVEFIEGWPALVYEAHSTDYQTAGALAQLAADHFAIQKVGPALTFAFRQAAFALSFIEAELVEPDARSGLAQALETAMLRTPRYWQAHYHGTPAEQAFARRYSLSDRVRYYWTDPAVQAALARLLSNLSPRQLPLSLLSQFTPAQYGRVRDGRLANDPQAILQDAVEQVLADYPAD